VYQHPSRPNLVIKVYQKKEDCEEARIKWLCANPPSLAFEKAQPKFGWPIEPVYDALTGDTIGFVMEKVKGVLELQAVVDPSSRHPAICRPWLWKVAEKILSRLHELHLRQYVVGDINFRNILVGRLGVVTFIDVDSFHFQIPNGQTFTTGGNRPELQPPELVDASGSFSDRDTDQDAFSAYVVVYRLICEGVHPFDCVYLGPDDPLPHHEMIRQGIWPEARKNPQYLPKPCKYPLSSLPPALQELFRRMFDDGLFDRSRRPTVTELFTCMQMHRPVGTHRSRVGARAWRQAENPAISVDPRWRRAAAFVKGKKRKALVTAACFAIAAASLHFREPAENSTAPRYAATPKADVIQNPRNEGQRFPTMTTPGRSTTPSQPSALEATQAIHRKPGDSLLVPPQLWTEALRD
jgi:serine/threonine protein kinase